MLKLAVLGGLTALLWASPSSAKTPVPEILGRWVSVNTERPVVLEYTEVGLHYATVGRVSVRALFWYEEDSGLLWHRPVGSAEAFSTRIVVIADRLVLDSYPGAGQVILRKERSSFDSTLNFR